jgi:hypothetical protein
MGLLPPAPETARGSENAPGSAPVLGPAVGSGRAASLPWGVAFLLGVGTAFIAYLSGWSQNQFTAVGVGLVTAAGTLAIAAVERIIRTQEVGPSVAHLVVSAAAVVVAVGAFRLPGPGPGTPPAGGGPSGPGAMTTPTSAPPESTSPAPTGATATSGDQTGSPQGADTGTAIGGTRGAGPVDANPVAGGAVTSAAVAVPGNTGLTGAAGPATATSSPESSPSAPHAEARVVYDNWGQPAVGRAMCRGNLKRPESMPGGTVTQTFSVPDGVDTITRAVVQIDPDDTVAVKAELVAGGTTATATAAATGDTTFMFGSVPVVPGQTVTLALSFSATSGKIITVYTTGTPVGTFTAVNECSDGAPDVSTSQTGLRAVVHGHDY